MKLLAAEALTGHTQSWWNTRTSAIVKLAKFDRSTSWMVFYQQYEVVADHNV
jgi:hypothetical protein